MVSLLQHLRTNRLNRKEDALRVMDRILELGLKHSLYPFTPYHNFATDTKLVPEFFKAVILSLYDRRSTEGLALREKAMHEHVSILIIEFFSLV